MDKAAAEAQQGSVYLGKEDIELGLRAGTRKDAITAQPQDQGSSGAGAKRGLFLALPSRRSVGGAEVMPCGAVSEEALHGGGANAGSAMKGDVAGSSSDGSHVSNGHSKHVSKQGCDKKMMPLAILVGIWKILTNYIQVRLGTLVDEFLNGSGASHWPVVGVPCVQLHPYCSSLQMQFCIQHNTSGMEVERQRSLFQVMHSG